VALPVQVEVARVLKSDGATVDSAFLPHLESDFMNRFRPKFEDRNRKGSNANLIFLIFY
jgi:hypothetical protein